MHTALNAICGTPSVIGIAFEAVPITETVIDQSMTLFEGLKKVGMWTFRNCH